MYNTSYQAASAVITGSEKYPDIRGLAVFVPTELRTMVSVSVYGLPKSEGECRCGVFAMHIHEGMTCTGNAEDPFADVKGHYNPNGCLHPCHKGDMPPLFADNGTAYFAFITTRFTSEDVIGHTIIIHRNFDDLHTQPSGNSGEKIACGEIMPIL